MLDEKAFLVGELHIAGLSYCSATNEFYRSCLRLFCSDCNSEVLRLLQRPSYLLSGATSGTDSHASI